ncbi:hypothetical protein JW887_06065, partial [Candidatus Dojkabacteria bacterium]|nr:hypothetical protein [Candidatus Dojkabacteria bacterium]
MIESKQRRNHWQAYSCQDGKLTLHAYESTIRCKPIQTILTTDYIQSVFADLKRTRLPMYTYDHIGKLVVLPIMDLHLGKLGWAKEVGDDYDLDIATALYKKSVLDILAKIKGYGLNIEKFIYPIGQDFYHYDSTTGTTTHGTRMDTDTRWQKMYKRGVELLVWTIELLRTIAPVEVYYTPGNHDEMLSYAATVSVQCYYDKIDAVVVNLSPTRRKYIRYGVGLIGLAHGDKEKTRIEDAMQLEAKEDWGQTVYREMYLGHLHSEHAKEAGGVIYRRIGSITAPDAWHDESAFIGATRRMEAFVWDRETGPELTIKSNVRIEKEEG